MTRIGYYGGYSQTKAIRGVKTMEWYDMLSLIPFMQLCPHLELISNPLEVIEPLSRIQCQQHTCMLPPSLISAERITLILTSSQWRNLPLCISAFLLAWLDHSTSPESNWGLGRSCLNTRSSVCKFLAICWRSSSDKTLFSAKP